MNLRGVDLAGANLDDADLIEADLDARLFTPEDIPKSAIEKIRKAENDLNRKLIDEGMTLISLNDYYRAFGLKPVDIGEAICYMNYKTNL